MYSVSVHSVHTFRCLWVLFSKGLADCRSALSICTLGGRIPIIACQWAGAAGREQGRILSGAASA